MLRSTIGSTRWNAVLCGVRRKIEWTPTVLAAVYAAHVGTPPEMRHFSEKSSASFETNKNISTASTRVEAIFQKIIMLDMFEVQMLTALMNEKMGINPGGVGMMASGASSTKSDQEQGDAEAAVEEKNLFDLKLTGFDGKAKIKVIKEVRSLAGLGLKEAKEMVEGSPKVILKDIKMEQAQEMKAKLEEVGAQVEIS